MEEKWKWLNGELFYRYVTPHDRRWFDLHVAQVEFDDDYEESFDGDEPIAWTFIVVVAGDVGKDCEQAIEATYTKKTFPTAQEAQIAALSAVKMLADFRFELD